MPGSRIASFILPPAVALAGDSTISQEKRLSSNQNEPSQPDLRYTQRLSITVGIVLLGLVASLLINIPSRTLTLHLLGSPLALHISGRYLVVALLVGLTCTGTEALIRTHSLAHRRQIANTFVLWTVPAVLVFFAALVLPHVPDRVTWLGGILATAIFLSLSLTAEYHTIDPTDSRYEVSQAFLTGMIYALALASFVLVYSAKSRSLFSATTIFFVTLLLTLERLRFARQALSVTGPYALVNGALIGESVWALNYSRVPGAMGGIFLLLTFHVVSGVAFQHLLGRLTSRVIVEYGLVALLGIGLTVYYFV